MCIYYYFIICVNKIAHLNIDFKLNYELLSLYNRKNTRIGKILLSIT